MSISSKILNFCSFGYANKSRFLVIDSKTFSNLKIPGKILLFSIRRISASRFACLLKKYDLPIDQNGLELIFVSGLSKKLVLQNLLSLTTILRCF